MVSITINIHPLARPAAATQHSSSVRPSTLTSMPLVLDALRKSGRPMTPQDIAATIDKTPSHVRKMLSELKREGLAANDEYGKWRAVHGSEYSQGAR